ncbi:MAG: ABC transporter permease [Thermoflexales bacterium]|nr:ABC transporter permease [Thermoflexales bacterium]
MKTLRIPRLWRAPGMLFGLALSVLLVVVAIFALQLAPFPPLEQHAADMLRPPGTVYALGSDLMGRDVLSRLMRGATNSLRVAALAVALAASLGTLVGLIAGYAGGWLDVILMRLADLLFAFPPLLLALAIVSALGAGAENAVLAIGIVYTPIFARVARAPTLLVKTREYVTAARAQGVSVWRILWRHILPNIAAPIIVQISLALAWAILLEASLSYLGLGTKPPEPSWGAMLSESRRDMEYAPWLAITPGAAIMLAVLGFNMLGDGLRDALDPQMRNT